MSIIVLILTIETALCIALLLSWIRNKKKQADRWDITKIKEYEQELIQAKEKLENIIKTQDLVFNSINFGLVYVDKNYVVQWESTASLKDIAKGRRYIAGKVCYETVMGRQSPCPHCALSDTVEKGKPVRHEITEGDTTVEISAIPVYSNDGSEMLGGLMKLEDISDKKTNRTFTL